MNFSYNIFFNSTNKIIFAYICIAINKWRAKNFFKLNISSFKKKYGEENR